MTTRTKILVRGTVQGVGFRPYVYSLAKRGGLLGQVLNNESGVLIDLEGDHEAIDHFVSELKRTPPALSNIESVLRQDGVGDVPFEDFHILPSKSNGSAQLPVAADTAVCDDCIRELFDLADRRYKYPFINCTNCGPRFTIVESVPYDRERTTMSEFKMCAACRAEYEDPLDRRFHAEPIACESCGPRIFLSEPPAVAGGFGGSGNELSIADRRLQQPATAGGSDLVGVARRLLRNGKIVAIKSLGGYHLACDATNAGAVTRLRQRKVREDKPFAMMAGSVEVIEKYCEASDTEKELLTSRERPIVLLAKRPLAGLPEAIAPGVPTFGFMLPYTPLHHLLLEGCDTPLVMTSGNISDEPIAYKDPDATEKLSRIADYFLTNDRRINIRMDDSIVRISQSKIQNPKSKIVIRRSRGYAPAPIHTSITFDRQILACGAELKNTFCMTRDRHAFVSHHIGDLENLETLRSFTEGIDHFKSVFDLEPKVIAYDLHPEYLSTKYAHSCEGIETKIGVQHHHAHIASCMVDNDVEGEVIGVAMDGLGFGTDGRLWGGEFFVADFDHAERIAHLDYVPMPGGVKAIHEPWRMAAVYLQKTFGDEFVDLDLDFNNDLDKSGWKTMRSMIATKTNCPETSSMGRLFDAVSAILCLRSAVNYEGQAAIALENIAASDVSGSYHFDVDGKGTIKTEPVIRKLVEELLSGGSPAAISSRFHLGVAELITTVAADARDKRNLNRVALSGGVFQNMFLLEAASSRLAEQGFEVLTHSRVPTNDGGISLGQAAVANAYIRSGRI